MQQKVLALQSKWVISGKIGYQERKKSTGIILPDNHERSALFHHNL